MSTIQEKSSFTYDPYTILQVEPRSTLNQVKMAYKTLAKIFHPDRPTGHSEMFRMINEAYQQILKQYQDRPQSVKDLQKARTDLKVTERGSVNKKNFNVRKFNEQFLQHRDAKRDNVYDVDHDGYQERTFSTYQAERSQVSQELEKMKPLFNRGQGFNPNVFNRMFDKLKNDNQHTELTNVLSEQFNTLGLVDQAQLATDHQLALTPHQQALGIQLAHHSSYQQPSPEEFENPDTLTSDQYDHYSQQPDITHIGALSKEEAKRRLVDYQAQQFTIPQGGPDPRRPMDLRDQMSQSVTDQPVGFLTYPASSQATDQQWTGNLENTHPSFLASQMPTNQLLPTDEFNQTQSPAQYSVNYDQPSNFRDFYQRHHSFQSPTTDQSNYPPPEQQLDPADFYDQSYSAGSTEPDQTTDSGSVADPSTDHQAITDMAVELKRLKQQMAVQDRLLRKMHRRNKQLAQDHNG